MKGILSLYVVFILFLSLTVSAELIEKDLYVAGDGLITVDDNGIEWLDLTETAGMSYLEVQSELGEGGAFSGWNIAGAEQVTGLFNSIGAQGPYSFPYSVNGYDGWSSENEGLAKELLTKWGVLQPDNERSQFMIADAIEREGYRRYGQVQGISLLNTKLGEDFFSLSGNLVTNETYQLPQLASALYRISIIQEEELVSDIPEEYQSAVYNSRTRIVDRIFVMVNNEPYLVSLLFEPASGRLYINDLSVMSNAPEHFNAEFNPETNMVLLHSVLVDTQYVSLELKFEGDYLSIDQINKSSLRLSEKGSIFSFSNRDEWNYVGIPSICVPSNCSQSISATIAGSSSYSFKEYKIEAIGRPFLISAADARASGNSITGFVDGLQAGQVIYPGEEVVFDLKGNKTGGRSGTFQYIISVDGMGDILINTFTGSICC